MTAIDIHCHTFNADDVPIRGFVERVTFQNHELGRDLASLVDLVIQGAAPGYREEIRRLDALLTTEAREPVLQFFAAPSDGLEAETDATLMDLLASEPALMRRLAATLPSSAADEAADDQFAAMAFGVTEIAQGIRALRRAVRWARLLGSSRLTITSRLATTFSGDQAVDLFTPMLVDLGMGLHDTAGTTAREQIELHEKISRLSMLGGLPGAPDARVHPFVGFDPRRQLQTSHDIEDALKLVQTAVLEYGFIGVKLYPPMGWRPIGNTKVLGMTEDEARRVDQVLREFYGWCQSADVPITAHCNASNAAHSDYLTFSDPETWAKVLEQFPGLHLNLGHFGGAAAVMEEGSWPHKIAVLTGQHDYLFADVGNHRIDKPEVAEGYLEALDSLFRDSSTSTMKKRLMYGSDWLMLALLPEHEQFAAAYRGLYQAAFGDEATADFMGRTARTFLGFDDPKNQNRLRLVQRYEKWASGDVPDWLTAPA